MNLDFEYIESNGVSECGNIREKNEDAMLLLPEAGCFFVADGIGGGEAGEVASGMLMEMIRKGMVGTTGDCPGERKQHLNDIVLEAHRDIQWYSRKNGFLKPMGSTLVGLVFDTWEPTLVHVCHAGDSRAYLFRDGSLQQLTKDHASSVRKHGVTRAVGAMPDIELEWNVYRIRPGDILLLCSDGMSDVWENQEIEEFLNTLDDSCEDIPQRLVLEATKRGSHDNMTVVMLRISEHLPCPVDVPVKLRKESDFLLQLNNSLK